MLSRTVMEEQLANKWPGLGQEAKQICQELSIPDITMTDENHQRGCKVSSLSGAVSKNGEVQDNEQN